MDSEIKHIDGDIKLGDKLYNLICEHFSDAVPGRVYDGENYTQYTVFEKENLIDDPLNRKMRTWKIFEPYRSGLLRRKKFKKVAEIEPAEKDTEIYSDGRFNPINLLVFDNRYLDNAQDFANAFIRKHDTGCLIIDNYTE